LIFSRYVAIKDGELNRVFFPAMFENGKVLTKTNLPANIPQEFIDDKYYINLELDTIYPNKPVQYKKNIYLLTDKSVFSAAEGFALFCKTTKWATVVGERTGGDGGGKDPVIFMLPNSGSLVRAALDAALNSDGSLNAEECTIPDIKIDADNADERLKKLIHYIKEKGH